MFTKQFNIIETNINHIQFKHLKIEDDDFNRYIIRAIFEDDTLYKYVTSYSAEKMKEIGLIYPIKQLIRLVKNLKKEYILECVPVDVKKRLCKDMKATYNGVPIDVKEQDWEIKFDEYLNDNIDDNDVVAEIILSKIIEEKFGADVFITKLALTTNVNMRVFGMDTVHYNKSSNTIFFGESKLTKNVDSGIKQHTSELALMDYKLCEECKLISIHENDIRCKDSIVTDKITEFGRDLIINDTLSILKIKEEDKTFNIAIVFFIAHGEELDYDYVTQKIEKFREKINLGNVEVHCITLPIKNKADFVKKIEEVIRVYEC